MGPVWTWLQFIGLNVWQCFSVLLQVNYIKKENLEMGQNV